MGLRQRTANEDAYPRALETAEARLVTERRQALQEAPAPDTATDSAAEEAASSILDKVSRRWRGFIRSRRRRSADDGTLNVDTSETKHVVLPQDTVGFGLSGGGIRSATFSLGIFQALAQAELVRKIDFLSTVSGGGYFGAFLGRLFTRPWIRTIDDVERVLQGIDPTAAPAAQKGWGRGVFRWLRDNGRYLAPRGSGDLIMLGAILLRNWLAVQVVLITTVLTLFVGLQIGRKALEHWLGMTSPQSAIAYALVCAFPGGATRLWWSPWILLTAVPLLVLAVPAGWAYWLVVRRRDGHEGLPPYVGLLAACALGFAAIVHYGARFNGIASRIPAWLLSHVPVSGVPHPVRLSLAAGVFTTGVFALACWLFAELRAVGLGTGTDTGNLVRNRLTGWMKAGLVAAAAVLAWSLVDTLGGTIYDLARTSERSLSHWAVGLFTAFAGAGAFARQLALLLAPSKSTRPSIPMSIASWIGAVIVATAWILAINVASQAVGWNFRTPRGAPPGLSKGAAPQVLGADHLVVASGSDGLIVRAAGAPAEACTAPMIERRPGYDVPVVAIVILGVLTFFFGRTRTFANMSSFHTFYAARLTRTYLGASNRNRLTSNIPVTNTVPGDDYSGQAYWNWPQVSGESPAGPKVARPYTKGGPLHLINTTINETLDSRTGVQNQDRRGTPLAIGPCGLTVGIRHHLVSTWLGVKTFPPDAYGTDSGKGGTGHAPYHVFRLTERSRTPDPLSLGRWMSVSGAAFSAAAGAQTTVPIAMLAGLFNVRLGYWWDSGTPSHDWWFERVLPVQAALFAETFARTRGTAGRLWNLSDGGHFENMAGYELIRRRLAIIVIIDAEADPDYAFEGLSDLVRKARLDFDAEITFLDEQQLSGRERIGGRAVTVPAALRPYFGALDALRRGRWTNEEVPYPPAPDNKQFTIEVDRTRVSRAHAALARVQYSDNSDAAWLVYVKATLMGDEPEDVCHYHRAHPAFPQETTIDQFFDERQWESYRRLGLHVGYRVLTKELFAFLDANPA
jgi:hypothetical protein